MANKIDAKEVELFLLDNLDFFESRESLVSELKFKHGESSAASLLERQVLKLRDELTRKLAPISRDAPDWETYRSWQLLAHLVAINNGKKLSTYKKEVLATRNVREKIRQNNSPILQKKAIKASKILHSCDLDGRIINNDLTISNKPNLIKGIFGLFSATPAAVPVEIISPDKSILNIF